MSVQINYVQLLLNSKKECSKPASEGGEAEFPHLWGEGGRKEVQFPSWSIFLGCVQAGDLRSWAIL